jgi:peptidoglycan/xylan/chitin deacetylase (PgdA/CDA1 family)
MKDLLARGWGVGNHSWSHAVIKPETVDLELRQAREVLEKAIDSPVVLYCSPGNNVNMSEHVLTACRQFGYLGAMSLTDALNRPGDELFWINRTALHDQYYEPFFSEYDPFRNVRHAQEDGGWIIDYCHCPLETPIHRNKDCSEAQLRRRFETVLAEGGDEVWCAAPEEVLFYHLTRRHTRIETVADTPEKKRYRLRFDDLSERVMCRALTLDAEVPAAWCREPKVWVDGKPLPASLARPRRLRVTVDVTDGMEIAFRAN